MDLLSAFLKAGFEVYIKLFLTGFALWLLRIIYIKVTQKKENKLSRNNKNLKNEKISKKQLLLIRNAFPGAQYDSNRRKYYIMKKEITVVGYIKYTFLLTIIFWAVDIALCLVLFQIFYNKDKVEIVQRVIVYSLWSILTIGFIATELLNKSKHYLSQKEIANPEMLNITKGKQKENNYLNVADQLLKLKELEEKGIISNQEFNEQKNKLLINS